MPAVNHQLSALQFFNYFKILIEVNILPALIFDLTPLPGSFKILVVFFE